MIALPTPVISPPPPIAAMTVRTCGKSSNISSPMVPCPAMKSWLSNGWMKVLSIPSNACDSAARHAASYDTGTMVAPSARMRSSLVCGAVSIATTEQGTPNARAA